MALNKCCQTKLLPCHVHIWLLLSLSWEKNSKAKFETFGSNSCPKHMFGTVRFCSLHWNHILILKNDPMGQSLMKPYFPKALTFPHIGSVYVCSSSCPGFEYRNLLSYSNGIAKSVSSAGWFNPLEQGVISHGTKSPNVSSILFLGVQFGAIYFLSNSCS